MEDFTKNFQFEANAGIFGGRIDGKSQFLFCFVKWLNMYEILGDAGGSDQIRNSQSAVALKLGLGLKVQRIARGWLARRQLRRLRLWQVHQATSLIVDLQKLSRRWVYRNGKAGLQFTLRMGLRTTPEP